MSKENSIYSGKVKFSYDKCLDSRDAEKEDLERFNSNPIFDENLDD
jgi:hypothetical protein